MKHTIQPSRLLAAATGLALVAGTFAASAPVQARPHTNSKTYKTGAIALGVLGAYFLSKGKTVEGAAALGGGYLAYKKGQKVQRDERYGRYNYPRYGYNNGYNVPNNGYNGNSNGYNGNSNGYNGNSNGYNGNQNGYDNGNDYRVNDRNQSGDWNSGWSGNADVRPQRGNNGHHYGQYKHHRGDDNRNGGDQDRD